MGAFDQAPHPLGVPGQLSDGQRVSDGGYIGMVHRLVGFGLNGDARLLIVRQHLVQRLHQQFGTAASALGFAHIGALARQPQNNQVGPEHIGDVDAAQ